MLYYKKSNIYCQKKGEVWLILSKSRKYYYKLNEVASFIWDLLDTMHSIESMVDALVKEFNVSKEVARNDIHEFLFDCKKRDFIV